VDAIKKIKRIEAAMKAVFIEMDTEIHMSLIALLARRNMVLLGPPGLAKTMISEFLVACIEDASYYYALFNKETTIKEILTAGTEILETVTSEGKKIKFIPIFEGSAVTGHIIFFDETFKGNSSLLNGLLPLLNDDWISVGGVKIKANRLCVFGASNEMPAEGEGLEALWDRYHIAVISDRIEGFENRILLREGARERRRVKKEVEKLISISEIIELQKAVLEVKIGRDIDELVEKIIAELLAEGIIVSDRTDSTCDLMIQANTLLHGRTDVIPEDLIVLCHSFWTRPEEIPIVRRIVMENANPALARILEVLDMAQELHDNSVMGADNNISAAAALGSEAVGKIRKLTGELSAMRVTGDTEEKRNEVLVKVDTFNKLIMKKCLGVDVP
jgi:MoxR-like ATPase